MRQSATRPTTFGDAAVDGFLSGMGAGGVMAAYLAVAGLTYGDALPATLGRFDPTGEGNALAGLLGHLAVAGIYGAMFGMAGYLLKRGARGAVIRSLIGAAYGLALYAFAAGMLLPAASSALQTIPAVHFALAHLVYGAFLGWRTHWEEPG